MSGRVNRSFPTNDLDYEIFRTSIREAIEREVGLLSLPWDEARRIVEEELETIERECSSHQTFDDYWCER